MHRGSVDLSSKSSHSDVAHEQGRSRRAWWCGLSIGLAIGASAGYFRSSYLGQWGSLDRPTFSLNIGSRLDERPPTYLEELRRARGGEEQHREEPDGWVASRLPQILRRDSSAFLREARANPDLKNVDVEEYLANRYGTPEKLARELFFRVTGRELPSAAKVVVVSESNWPSDRYTGSNHLGIIGVSLVREQPFLDQLTTILHELGHQIAPVGESQLLELGMSELALAREEAAAYLFEYAAVRLIDDEFLSGVLLSQFLSARDRSLERLQSGEITSHTVGMAIADAALTLYPTDRAWQIVATGRVLPEELKAALEELLMSSSR